MRERDVVVAAQRGDRRAREQLVRALLPLIYNVAGRALGGHPDVEDVVQETMLRVVRDLGSLRQPESVRSWALTIAMHQISSHQELASGEAGLDQVPEAGADFEELAILRLRLSGERRQVAEAARWLDEEDRTVLALWWQEAAGELARAESAAALGTTPAYAAVRVQRMRAQLDRGRAIVAALAAQPRCAGLAEAAAGWDGRPGPLWRKRIDRHVRDCPVCLAQARGQVAVERLLAGCALVPVPAGVAAAATKTAGGLSLVRLVRPRVFSVAAAAAAVVVVGGAMAYSQMPAGKPKPTAQIVAAPSSVPVTTAAPSPSVLASSVPAKAKPSPSKTAKKVNKVAAAGCGAGLDSIWASWPMVASPKYTDLGNGTVRDESTCLVWQKAVAPSTHTFTDAKSYCAGLDLDGDGWHLPSRIELTSIIDASRSGPAIDRSAFPGTPAQFFWTSSPWAVTKEPLRAWIINFYEGLASNGAYQSGAYQVRCVRSGDGAGRPKYEISGSEVSDPATGLTWQRGQSATMTAAAADAHCADLGMRLPTLRELSTTVDETRVAPAIDIDAFPSTVKNGWYWTSTEAAPDPTKRWALNYDDGYTNYRKATEGYARCVG
ncbi:sigma-70 family RNA polymerase sigma factor [Actinoplanes sp. NPDC026619]|uniref:sigma-70 family RNA polymerase sigma factor n=1 Tax=Actinoplanes sp. NPDC026619 TaxID=3155798 RepID=UPI00340F5B59